MFKICDHRMCGGSPRNKFTQKPVTITAGQYWLDKIQPKQGF